MKFEEAREKLKGMANGKPYLVGYEELFMGNGRLICTTCRVYIEGTENFAGQTFSEAFAQLRYHLNPHTRPVEFPELESDLKTETALDAVPLDLLNAGREADNLIKEKDDDLEA